jgi:hypothetical protein
VHAGRILERDGVSWQIEFSLAMRETVLYLEVDPPISANFRSSKMTKSCWILSSVSRWIMAGEKSSRMSMCVFKVQ